jgi:hypothetical protein
MDARRAADCSRLFPSPQRGPRDEHARTFRESLHVVRTAAKLEVGGLPRSSPLVCELLGDGRTRFYDNRRLPDHQLSSVTLAIEAKHLGLKFADTVDTKSRPPRRPMKRVRQTGEQREARKAAKGGQSRQFLAPAKKRRFVNRKSGPPACSDEEIMGPSWNRAFTNAQFGMTPPLFHLVWGRRWKQALTAVQCAVEEFVFARPKV